MYIITLSRFPATLLRERLATRTFLEAVGGVEPRIRVQGFAYRVVYAEGVRPRRHVVRKDRTCDCALGADCPAVQAVATYLQAGGARAPDPPPGTWDVAPATCPICQAPAVPDASLRSKVAGAGWRCTAGGSEHYYRARTTVRDYMTRREWIIPPVPEAGYPGVRRGELVSRAGPPPEWTATGYNPDA